MNDVKDELPEDDAATDQDSVAAEDQRDEAEQLWDEFEEEDRAASARDKDAGEDDAAAGHDNEDDPKPSVRDGADKTPKQDAGNEGKDDTIPDDPKALQEQVERLQQHMKSQLGRANSEISRLQKQLAETRKRNEARKGTADTASDEGLKKVQEEYGDVINPVVAEITNLKEAISGLRQGEEERQRELEGQITELVEREQGVFLSEHPDGFKAVRENQQVFMEWVEDQPKHIRDAFEANKRNVTDGKGAALVMSLFKQAMNTASGTADKGRTDHKQTSIQSRRESQLRGSRSQRPTNRSAKVSDMPAGSGTPQDDWDYWERKGL